VTEAEQVTALMESVVNGQRSAVEVSDLLEINLGVIQRVAARMTEQRLGVPARPPDDLLRAEVLPGHAPEMGVTTERKLGNSAQFPGSNGLLRNGSSLI
jgi:hypothetical protein